MKKTLRDAVREGEMKRQKRLLLCFNNVSSSQNAGREITLVFMAARIFMLHFIQRFVLLLSEMWHTLTAALRNGRDLNII